MSELEKLLPPLPFSKGERKKTLSPPKLPLFTTKGGGSKESGLYITFPPPGVIYEANDYGFGTVLIPILPFLKIKIGEK